MEAWILEETELPGISKEWLKQLDQEKKKKRVEQKDKSIYYKSLVKRMGEIFKVEISIEMIYKQSIEEQNSKGLIENSQALIRKCQGSHRKRQGFHKKIEPAT